jgi:hypothetical protein
VLSPNDDRNEQHTFFLISYITSIMVPKTGKQNMGAKTMKNVSNGKLMIIPIVENVVAMI